MNPAHTESCTSREINLSVPGSGISRCVGGDGEGNGRSHLANNLPCLGFPTFQIAPKRVGDRTRSVPASELASRSLTFGEYERRIGQQGSADDAVSHPPRYISDRRNQQVLAHPSEIGLTAGRKLTQKSSNDLNRLRLPGAYEPCRTRRQKS